MQNHHPKFTEGIYLLLGSNLGNRIHNLQVAAEKISERVNQVQRKSPVFVTEPWGVSNQPTYFNQVLQLSEAPPPYELLGMLQAIEKKIGKIKLGKWRERLIDIDILYYGDIIMDEVSLCLPHPEIQNRRFALVPMCELAPELLHPIFQLTQIQLLERCEDPLEVIPLHEIRNH
ncbi:MAG: 2-amino-4-hydroxy-6-hydroxymethyldihydropteridine diphosphokinase [Cyclobacteriaceae bacterium]